MCKKSMLWKQNFFSEELFATQSCTAFLSVEFEKGRISKDLNESSRAHNLAE